MSGVNKVILVGNVGKDPEVRSMPNGTKVANFSIATSETWKDKNTGEKQEKSEWHNIVVFNRLAEIVEQYIKKGSKIYAEGKLQTRSWEQDGVKKYMTEINCNQLQMLDTKPVGTTPPVAGSGTGSQHSNHSAPSNFDNFDDSIPF